MPLQIHFVLEVLLDSFLVNAVQQETLIQHYTLASVSCKPNQITQLTLILVCLAHFSDVRLSFFCMPWMLFQTISCPIPPVSILVVAKIVVLASEILQISIMAYLQWSPKSSVVCQLDLDSMRALLPLDCTLECLAKTSRRC